MKEKLRDFTKAFLIPFKEDNPAKLNSYLSFIYWGEKYGWD